MGVNLKTVQKMCRTGRLPAEKVGPRLWRIDKNAALEQGALDRINKKPAGAANTDELTG
ncbi:DNA-binding protein [Faecalibacterium sp. OF03-6AC]|jgi:excisionase family DNA binding protein|uniref:helix-turn-helix domain-containing protein n=1 Tax=Faecalibacterium TaxID=216851 RepID=UPI000E5265FC|nr:MULTISPECIES: helix-turn-helix domain-containing protein [Faecalibacterium]RHP62099.1 DNA-binding protein [Faecalibacterium sp. OF03-6AC]